MQFVGNFNAAIKEIPAAMYPLIILPESSGKKKDYAVYKLQEVHAGSFKNLP